MLLHNPGRRLPVKRRPNVPLEAFSHASTLMAGRTAGMQGEVRVWFPNRSRSWLALACWGLLGLIALSLARHPGEWIDWITRAELGAFSLLGIVITARGLRHPCYLTTDDRGIGLTMAKGSRYVLWSDVIRCELKSRSRPRPSELILYSPEPIRVALAGYQPAVQSEILSLVKERCNLVTDPGDWVNNVPLFRSHVALVSPAPDTETDRDEETILLRSSPPGNRE